VDDVVLRGALSTRRSAARASVLRDGSSEASAEYDVTTLRSIRTAVLCIAAVLFFSGNLQGVLSNVGNSI
jgi:hypothetical protein